MLALSCIYAFGRIWKGGRRNLKDAFNLTEDDSKGIDAWFELRGPMTHCHARNLEKQLIFGGTPLSC